MLYIVTFKLDTGLLILSNLQKVILDLILQLIDLLSNLNSRILDLINILF